MISNMTQMEASSLSVVHGRSMTIPAVKWFNFDFAQIVVTLFSPGFCLRLPNQVAKTCQFESNQWFHNQQSLVALISQVTSGKTLVLPPP